jgi:O-antigen/teichoic acid export membrane protein
MGASSKSVGNDVLRLTISKVVTMVISMISAMLLSRFRTLGEYGTYSQLLMIVSIATSLIMLGLPNSINFFLAGSESQIERRKFLSVYYTLSTVLSFIIGFVLVLSVPLLEFYFENDQIRGFIYFFAIYPWARIVASSVENVLIVLKKTHLLMYFRITNSISLLLIIFIVQSFGISFKNYILIFLLVEIFFALIVYKIVNSISGGIELSFDTIYISRVLKYSLPIGLASVVGTMNHYLDQLMIGKFYNTEQLAIYANAGRELPITIIASTIVAVLLPVIVRLIKKQDYKIALELWGSSIVLSYTIISFFAIGIFTYAPEVMSLLYSEKYLPGVPIFRVYSLVLLLRCTYFGIVLNASGKSKFIFYSSIASLFLNGLLNYLFLFVFGLVGPAIATLLSQLLINLIQLAYTAKNMKISFSKVFPWKNIGKLTMLNVILGLAFHFLKEILRIELRLAEIGESVFLGLFWSLLYFLIVRKEVFKNWKSLNSGGDL